ncbi:pentapeptide repeat-containing protein [Microbacterium pumilum]|uniref:pentapeptide repeat-containing protein n=1 Tax=Microbacterium pumilum TaxID=344165 RepID=UPI003CD06824
MGGRRTRFLRCRPSEDGLQRSGADFTDADLTDANLNGAILSRSIFRNTKLGNANLTDTNLAAAIFEGTTLSITRDATPTSARTTLVSYWMVPR